PIYTTLSWKINVGGKPVVSIPAFVIIAFELTILFGALATFFGFLLFSKLPVLKQIIDPVDYDKQFVILVKNGEK
ncbi:MAG TPA: quinol:electron acceptor oxidoreductase subunit ActD, partial [bacterium]